MEMRIPRGRAASPRRTAGGRRNFRGETQASSPRLERDVARIINIISRRCPFSLFKVFPLSLPLRRYSITLTERTPDPPLPLSRYTQVVGSRRRTCRADRLKYVYRECTYGGSAPGCTAARLLDGVIHDVASPRCCTTTY